MKKKLNLTLLSIFLILIACSPSPEVTGAKDGKISIPAFKNKLASVDNPQLIDVRTPEEFEAGTLDGAINIDFRAASFEAEIAKLDKDRPVFVFCRSGGRSGKSYKKMKNIGFSEVYDMEGGYSAWTKQ